MASAVLHASTSPPRIPWLSPSARPTSEATSKERAGDHHDFLSLAFRSNYRWLTDRLRYKLGCGHAAEDVAAEAFVQLAAVPNVTEVREPRALLTTIAYRITYEIWRRSELERSYIRALTLEPEKTHPSPEDQALIVEALLAVDRALSGVSVKARTAFLYSQLDDMTYTQIAEKMSVSVSMVRKYMTQVLTACFTAAEA